MALVGDDDMLEDTTLGAADSARCFDPEMRRPEAETSCCDILNSASFEYALVLVDPSGL